MDMMEVRRRVISSMASGLPTFVGKMAGGSFILDQDLTPKNYPAGSIYPYAKYPIAHNLGKIPDGVIVYRFTGDVTKQSANQAVVFSAYIKNPTNEYTDWLDSSVSLYSRSGARSDSGVQAMITTGITEIGETIFKVRGNNTIPYKAGETYYWIAWTQND